MELKLTDKIKQFNDNQRYTQQVKAKAVRKAQVEQFFEGVGTGIKKAVSAIPEIPSKIKRLIDDAKQQRIENQQTLGMYASYLNYADQTCDQTGIEFDPESKNFKVIFTDFGPLFIETFPDILDSKAPISVQAIEGFIPFEDGFMKYFNGQLQSQPQTNTVVMTGRNIDPESLNVSKVESISNFKNNKVLFYLKKQEELARKKVQTTQPTEQEKQ